MLTETDFRKHQGKVPLCGVRPGGDSATYWCANNHHLCPWGVKNLDYHCFGSWKSQNIDNVGPGAILKTHDNRLLIKIAEKIYQDFIYPPEKVSYSNIVLPVWVPDDNPDGTKGTSFKETKETLEKEESVPRGLRLQVTIESKTMVSFKIVLQNPRSVDFLASNGWRIVSRHLPDVYSLTKVFAARGVSFIHDLLVLHVSKSDFKGISEAVAEYNDSFKSTGRKEVKPVEPDKPAAPPVCETGAGLAGLDLKTGGRKGLYYPDGVCRAHGNRPCSRCRVVRSSEPPVKAVLMFKK